MNYIVEGDFDFFSEIMKDNNKEPESSNDTCLLSGLPLSDNHIELHCKHKFNYSYLFNEVKIQKTVYNPNSSTRLKHNELMCPYCRQITTQLLPYIPNIAGVDKITGVNRPQSLCMKYKSCEHILTRGGKKGAKCGHNAFDSEHGILCEKHWNKVVAKTHVHDENTQWTAEMEQIMNNNTILSLKEKLREKKLLLKGNKRELVMRIVSHNNKVSSVELTNHL